LIDHSRQRESSLARPDAEMLADDLRPREQLLARATMK